jgi:glycosyltransferase involved in cell wall biosynthesis
MTTPLLSVCMITYNHIKYIREAIDGVLMQKVNFPWEIIIADDFSTDGTREIVLEYKKKYPNLIKLILQENNVGPAKNFMDLMSAPKSKYIAYIEGDDYWTDDLKLEKQVSLMLENPGCSISVHPCYLHKSIYNKKSIGFFKGDQVRRYGISDILKNAGQTSPSSSYVILRDIIDILPPWINSAPVGDLIIEMYSMKLGFGLYMPDVMSAYRVISQNSWSDMMQRSGGRKLINLGIGLHECVHCMEHESAFIGFDFNILKSTSYLDIAIGHLLGNDFDNFKGNISESYAIYPDSSHTQKWLYRLKNVPGLALFLYNLKIFFDRGCPVKIF